MTFEEHMTVWNGLYPDLDNAYGAQCMDEMHLYHVEVLGLTNKWYLAASGPKEVYNNFNNLAGHEYFEKIANTPTGVPQEGDIMLWGTGTYGHVGIFIEGDVNTFRSFEQNYPTGSPCHVQNHTSYDGVLGWLRYKGTAPTSVQVEFEKCVTARNEHWTTLINIANKLGIETSPTLILAEIDKLITYEDLVVQKDRQLAEVQQKSVDLQKQLQETNVLLKEAQEHNATLTQEVQKDQRMIEALTRSVSSLQASVQELQSQSTQQFSGWRLTVYNWLRKGV